MNNTFTAIDFETAQGKRWSICQIGLIRVENGEIVKKIDMLIKPPDNYYWYKNIEVHGITARDTANSPTFDEVWHQIKPYIEDQTVVAHNAAFDVSCLKQTLQYYDLAPVSFEQKCTYRIFGTRLNVACAEYNIPLNHHDALSDALACAELYKIHLGQNL